MRVGGGRQTVAIVLSVFVVVALGVGGIGIHGSAATDQATQPAEVDTNVAFAYVDSDGNIRIVDRDGSEAEIDVGGSAAHIGSGEDINGDGYVEIPFVDGGGTLYIVNKTADPKELASNVDTSDQGAKVAIGKLDGYDNHHVFFATSDGSVKAVNAVSGTNRTLVDSSSQVAVAGVGDITGDGEPEVVYTDGSNMGYYNGSGSVSGFYSGGIDSNNGGLGIGAPRDFDGEDAARIPTVANGGTIRLVDQTGSAEALGSGAGKYPVAGVNWSGDSQLEVMHLDTNGAVTSMLLNGTTNQVSTSGDPSVAAGVAWLQSAPAFELSNFTVMNTSGNLTISFDANRQVTSTNVTLRGPENTTLTISDFDQTVTDDNYTYESLYEPSLDGDYKGTLVNATAATGETADPNDTDSATIDTPFNVTNLNATADGSDISFSFESTHTLDSASVTISGPETETLNLNDISTDDDTDPYIYEGTYQTNQNGTYNVTLTDATAMDQDTHDDNLTDSVTTDTQTTTAPTTTQTTTASTTTQTTTASTTTQTTDDIGGGGGGGGASTGGSTSPEPTSTQTPSTDPPDTTTETAATTPVSTTIDSGDSSAESTRNETASTAQSTGAEPTTRAVHNVEMPFGSAFGVPGSTTIFALLAGVLLVLRTRRETE